MKPEKRDIAVCIILSFVTFGIYSIIWQVRLGRDSVKVKDPNDDGLLEVLCLIFLPFLGGYLAEKKLYEGAAMRGIQLSDNSIVYLILGLFGLGIVNMALLQSDLNKISDYADRTGGFNGSGYNGGYNNQYNNQYSNQNTYNQQQGFGGNPGYGTAPGQNGYNNQPQNGTYYNPQQQNFGNAQYGQYNNPQTSPQANNGNNNNGNVYPDFKDNNTK